MDGTVTITIKEFDSFRNAERNYTELLSRLNNGKDVVKIHSETNSSYPHHIKTNICTSYISKEEAFKEFDSYHKTEIAKLKASLTQEIKNRQKCIDELHEDCLEKRSRIESLNQEISELNKKKWYHIFK
jgi:uncharacterized coiled-coil DUF342 family protein